MRTAVELRHGVSGHATVEDVGIAEKFDPKWTPPNVLCKRDGVPCLAHRMGLSLELSHGNKTPLPIRSKGLLGAHLQNNPLTVEF